MSLAAHRAENVDIDDRPGSDVRHDLNVESTENETLAEDFLEYQCQIATFPMGNGKLNDDIGSPDSEFRARLSNELSVLNGNGVDCSQRTMWPP